MVKRTPFLFCNTSVFPEPQNAIAFAPQKPITHGIVTALSVLSTIDLDHQLPITADKVDIVGADWLLAHELEAAQSPIT